jgi:hypothetical protein
MRNILERFIQWFESISGVDRTYRAQSDHVRRLARTFRLTIFPERLKYPENCSVCNESSLLLVHPDMICFSCLLDATQCLVDAVQEAQMKSQS